MANWKTAEKETKNVNPQQFFNNMLFPVMYGPDWQDIQKEKRAWGTEFQAGEKPEGMGDITWSQVTQSPVYQYDEGPDVPVTTFLDSHNVSPTSLGQLRFLSSPDFDEDETPIRGINTAGQTGDPLDHAREGLEGIAPVGDEPFEGNWQLSPFGLDSRGRSTSAIHGDWVGAPAEGQRMWLSGADTTLAHELGHAIGVQSVFDQHKDKDSRTNWDWYTQVPGDSELSRSLQAGGQGKRYSDYLAIPLEADQRNMEFVRRMATTKEVVDPKTGEKTWVEIPGNELMSEGRENRNINMNQCNLIQQIPANEDFWVYFNENIYPMSSKQKFDFMNS